MKAYNELKVSLVRHTTLPVPGERYRKAKSKDVTLFAEIWIDDTRLYHPGLLVYPQQLIASAEKSGNCLILCNGCGIAACGCGETFPIQVVHQQNTIVWRRNEQMKMKSWRFQKEQYIEATQQLKTDLNTVMKKYQRQLQAWEINPLPYDLWGDWCLEQGTKNQRKDGASLN